MVVCRCGLHWGWRVGLRLVSWVGFWLRSFGWLRSWLVYCEGLVLGSLRVGISVCGVVGVLRVGLVLCPGFSEG